MTRSSKTILKYLIGAVAVIAVFLYFILRPASYSEKEIMESAIEAGNYLTGIVDENGKFDYDYNPIKDSSSGSYNILRHAGAVYSMFELYGYTKDEELFEAAERALKYLEARIDYCAPLVTNPLPESACVIEKDNVKLGGNGLALVAFAEYTEITNDRRYIPLMQDLAKWIVSVQSPAGEFTVHKQDLNENKIVDFTSGYYPGEALLGLSRLYELDPDPLWIDSAIKGAKWLINVRDGKKTTKQLDHDHWLLYALNDIQRQSPDQQFIDHSFKIVQAILDKQRQTPPTDNPEWLGSYYTPPRSTPTATRSEGLAAAFNLATDFGYPEKAAEIRHALDLAIPFQLSTQMTKSKAYTLRIPNPQKALGGFHEALDEYSIRIDYVQHNISAILAYYDIITAKTQL